MAYFYGSTLASFFAAQATALGTTLAVETAIVQANDDSPLQESGRYVPTIPSEFVVIDPREDVRQGFEVDFTVDPSRFGAPQVGANHHSSPREETWFATADGPTKSRGIFSGEFDRAKGLLASNRDEEAFDVLHGVVTRAGTPVQKRLALIGADSALEGVFEDIPLDSTTAFEVTVENPVLRRRYFLLTRELWRFRARFLLEVLFPDVSTPDERNRLGSWGRELSRRARDFHIDLVGDESHQRDQLAANRRHQDRADELTVQEALFVRDFSTVKAVLNLLLARSSRDQAGQLREYRLYRLGVAIYQSLGDREKAHRLRFQALVFADSLLQSAPDQAIQDFLRAAEELSISNDHENEELDFITDVLFGCLNRIRRGPVSHERVVNPESISRGFFLVVARRIEVLIRQTPLSERRAQIGELQALRDDVRRLENDLPRWQGWDDAEFYQERVDAVLWELSLILVRSHKAAGRPEQAAETLFAAIISDLPEGDHVRLYRAYRLLEEISDAAGWEARAIDARLRAEAHAQVLRARGEEVPS